MPKPRRRAGRPAATPSAETRERILRAACERFAAAGYAHATNAEIAEAAGVTSAALYHYFDSKAALFAATYRHYLDVILEAYRAASSAPEGAVAKLTAMVRTNVALNRDHPELAGFFAIAPLELLRHPEVAKLTGDDGGAELTVLFRGVLEEGVRRGELPKRLPIASVVHLLVAASYGLSWSHGISTPAQHDAVMVAFEALLEGKLFREDPK
jgi:AcrR family transcriptional regulator